MPDARSAVSELVRRSRARGLRVTPQRTAIYRVLAESRDHPDPEALHRLIRPTMPSVSLATVYKTLAALAALGLVRQVHVAGTKRYDANLERHHHLVCTRCRKVTDLHDAGLDRIAPPRHLYGFHVEEVSVQVLGRCAGCSRTTRKSARKGTLAPGPGRTQTTFLQEDTWQSRSREPRRIRT
jgi:Fur family transcriptional regulator, peroxide stress response regulator